MRKRLIQPQKASYARICNIEPDVVCKTLKRKMKFASQLSYTDTGEFSKLCFSQKVCVQHVAFVEVCLHN